MKVTNDRDSTIDKALKLVSGIDPSEKKIFVKSNDYEMMRIVNTSVYVKRLVNKYKFKVIIET